MLKLASILSFYVKLQGVHRGCHWKVAVGWVGEGGWLVGNESVIAFEFLDRHLLLYMYILGTAFIVFSSEITCVS